MDEDFLPSDFPVSWGEHVRDQLLASIRKASLCFGTTPATPEQVHRTRRLLKEANALALLLEKLAGAPAARAAGVLRSFRRELSDRRDFDVMLQSLDRFAPSLEADLIGQLREEIEERRRLASGSAFAVRGSDLAHELRRLSEETRDWRVGTAAGPAELILALRRSYGKARRQGERAFASRAPAELHALRKASILHRAQRAAFAHAWPKLVNAWCTEAQTLRDALGAFNDLAVFAAFVAARVDARKQAPPLLTLIESDQAEVLARAEPIFLRLFCARSKELARHMEVLLASPKKRPKAADRASVSRGSETPEFFQGRGADALN